MAMLRRLMVAAACIVFAALTAPAQADAVNKSLLGDLAVDGYDVVAYHTEHRALKGQREFRHAWNGASWQFASRAHLQAFKADPARYAPQYGGYCAYAVAVKNERVDIDPQAFTIVDGKLYLNYSKKIQTQWETRRAEYIRAGDRNWQTLGARP